MPSYGTKIADFKGVLHDVSKSAFDALAMQDVDGDLKTATDPFRETINKYLKKVGLEVDWTEPGAVEKLLKNTAAKVAAAYAGKVVASAAAVLAGEEIVAAEIAGPIGALVGLITEVAIVAFNRLRDYTPKGGYQPGSWVMIDNGAKTVSRKVERAISWGEAAMFGDAPIREDLEFDREEDYSIGFIMGPGPEQGEWTVFNFKIAEEETLAKHKLRPCDEETARQLDGNPEMSIVRELKFVEDDEAFLAGFLPTKPGSQVLFQGKPYRIVRTEGEHVVIENEHGDQLSTNINNLVRGRVSSNISQNIKDGKPVADGFSTQPLDAIYRGQWIWVPPSIDQKVRFPEMQRSLAVVVNLEGNRVRGVHCIDGKIWQVGENQIEAADIPTIVATISGIKEFTNFRARCTSGRASESELILYAPGKKYPYVCMGVGQSEGRDVEPKKTRKVRFGSPDYEYVGFVGDYGEKDEAEKEEERIEKGYAIAGDVGEKRLYPQINASGTGTNIMMLLAGAGILFFIFGN